MDPVLGQGERPDGQGEVEVAVPTNAPERPHRRAATDGLELRDEVDGRDLRRTRHRSTGEGRVEDLGEPDLCAEHAFDARDHVLDAGELARGHQLRPAHRPRLADAGEVVPLEVDDHHVLGSVLRGVTKLMPSPGRAGALDGHRPHPPAPTREEELRRRGHDRPALADEGLPRQRVEVRERGGEREGELARVSRAGRREMLDEIDLVDVASLDRGAHAVDRGGVLRRSPGRLPRPNHSLNRCPKRRSVVTMSNRIRLAPDGAGEQRQRGARLRRRRCVRPADRLRQAVTEVEIGDQLLGTAGEEALLGEPLVQAAERAVGLAQLERRAGGASSHRATPGSGERARSSTSRGGARASTPPRAPERAARQAPSPAPRPTGRRDRCPRSRPA